MNNLLMITGDRALASGKQGAFFNTLQELRKHFDRIDVICPRVAVHRYDMTVLGNVFVHPSPWPLVLQWLWVWRQGKRIVREHKPALATVHDYAPFYNGIGARLLKHTTGLPYLLEVMHIPSNWFKRWLTRRCIAWDARPARAVRVINKQVLEELVMLGIPREKIQLIPAFYIDLDIFKPQEVAKQYDLIFVGRNAPNKGFELFEQVVRLTGLKPLVIGDGHRFVKDSAEVAKLMNESRLLLMTSYDEGGPRVVLEAMACGIPVVATPVGIVPEVLPPECIETWDAAALADKVKNILGDDDLRSRLVTQGIATASPFERVAAITRYADAIKTLSHA
jgi:glycosyltransferase involved in cell wall biosynthesis